VDKAGLGSGGPRPESKTSGGEEVEDLYQWYRAQRSNTYHTRLASVAAGVVSGGGEGGGPK